VDHHHPLLASLGKAVRSLRQARGWTRRELARESGISERFLADVERGLANPSVLRLLVLAQALGTGLGELVGSSVAAVDRSLVALLGLRGAGKSTVGPLLANALGRKFVELDARVEAMTRLGLGELFELHGEAYYRRAERQALQEIVASEPRCVLAVGGGLVTEAETFSLLRSVATTVWLRARPADHWERVRAQGDLRPMADNARAFEDLGQILAEREPLYRRADLTVDTSRRSASEVVQAVLAGLPDHIIGDSASRRPPGPA
jgi:XRE family aerobic/anaerobic benzoate catabolism transcriptional regulator